MTSVHFSIEAGLFIYLADWLVRWNSKLGIGCSKSKTNRSIDITDDASDQRRFFARIRFRCKTPIDGNCDPCFPLMIFSDELTQPM